MRILILFFIFLNLFIYGQNQVAMSEYEIYYKVKFQNDTANSNQISEEILSLLIGDKISLFKSTQKAIYDSLSLAEVEKSEKLAKGGRVIINLSNIPKPKFKPEILKINDEIVGYNELLMTIYEYPILEKISWKILNETKVIENYNCRKALGRYNNREYVAWFTKEIPISDGPYIFKGLPGLVLEVYDQKKLYNFNIVGLKKVKKPIIPTIAQIKTEQIKFVKARSNFLADPIGVFESQSKFKIPVGDKERLIKMHQSNNNFID